MVEFLTVSPDARLDAVRRQVAQLRGKQIALQLPPGWDELNNPARVRLLQRQVQAQRSELALVTADAATTKAAHALGIPVFLHPEDAAQRAWQMDSLLPWVDPRRPAAALPEPPPWRRSKLVAGAAKPTLHKARQERIALEAKLRRAVPAWLSWVGYGLFGALILFLLGLFARYVLPAATITVRPGVQQISVTTRLVANPDLEESDLTGAQIKGRLIETIVEETGTIATTGALQRPTVKATGQVVFSNLGTGEVRVPLGTGVSTSTGTPVNFRTLAEATLPGGVGQRVTVPIEALEPGIEGNVRANTITNIDGPLRFRARVSNPNGTGGGGSELVRAVTQEDKDKLLAEVLARAEARAPQALGEKIEAGEWLPPESVNTFVVAQAFDQYNDDTADQLGLTLRLLAQGVTINDAETREVLQTAVQQQIPSRGMLVADSLAAQRVPGATPVGRGVEFTVTVNADYVTPVDPGEVRSAVAGLSEEEASQVLQQRWLLAAPPEFYRDPAWLNSLPALPSRIQVRLDYGTPVSALP